MIPEDLLNPGWTIESTTSFADARLNDALVFTQSNDGTYSIMIGMSGSKSKWATSCVSTPDGFLTGFHRGSPFYIEFGDHEMSCYLDTASHWPKWPKLIGLSAILGAAIGFAAKVTTGAPLWSVSLYIATAVGGSLVPILVTRPVGTGSAATWVAEDGSGVKDRKDRIAPGPRAVRAGAARA